MPENSVLADLQQYEQHESAHVRSRAQIILQILAGKAVDEIVQETKISLATVKKWQRAWEERGMAIFPETNGDTPHVPAPVEVTATPVETPAYTFDQLSPVQPQDAMAEAGRKTLLAQLQQMLTHEPIARAGEDREGVHKMRVATRRLRSAYRLFEPFLSKKYFKKLPGRLRSTARALGQVRDLDVFMIKAEKYIEREGKQAELAPLMALVQARHSAARQQLVDWLDSKDYAQLVQRLYELASESYPGQEQRVLYVLPEMIYHRLKTVREYADYLSGADYETLHGLRIEFKRLRYTLEFFTSVLGKQAERVIKEIKDVQEHLGDLNDAVVAVDLIDTLLPQIPADQQAGTLEYRAMRQAEVEKLTGEFATVWEHFNRQEVREQLAQAVAVL